jgi:Calcineurin-like phosphoesterase
MSHFADQIMQQLAKLGLCLSGLACCGGLTRSMAQDSLPQIVHSLGDSKPMPWTSLELQRSPRDFQFAVVADNAGTPRPGVWREAMGKLNLLQPAFVMSVGDLIEGYVSTPEELNRQWDNFLSDLSPLQLPFFFVAGNHDVGRPMWYDVYRQRIGPTWYFFIHQDVLFLILDTNDGPDHGTGISDQQIAWIEQVLTDHPAAKVRWTMVFQHKPLWNEKNPQWARINRMLTDRERVTVMAGHIHEYKSTQIDGIEYVALATTGGGSPLAGRDAGELDHVTWVTMRDSGPIVVNLALDGILPIDFRTNESAQKHELLSKGRFLQVQPIDQRLVEFHEGKSQAIITNPVDQPMRVRVLMEPPPGVIVRPAAINCEIDGKSEAKIELTISADSPLPISKIQPIALHWEAIYDRPGNTALQWNGTRTLIIDGQRHIPFSDKTLIDGDLSDWIDLPYTVNQPAEIHTNKLAWRGPTDTNIHWGVVTDGQRLYFGVEVIDDQIEHDGDMLWQDFAGIFVNPIVVPGAKPEQIKKEMFAIMAGLSMSPDDFKRYQFGNAPDDCQSAARHHGNKIQYEFSVPTQHFDEVQNGRWDKLQLNVIVNDFDSVDQHLGVSVLYWRPRWDGSFHYPTSGLFERTESQGPR